MYRSSDFIDDDVVDESQGSLFECGCCVDDDGANDSQGLFSFRFSIGSTTATVVLSSSLSSFFLLMGGQKLGFSIEKSSSPSFVTLSFALRPRSALQWVM